MNIPASTIAPFGYTGMPMLWCDDPNFSKADFWIDLSSKFRRLLWNHSGKSNRVLWEEAAMLCGAEWSTGYENATPEGYLILNVKMPNVRDTQIFEFNSSLE